MRVGDIDGARHSGEVVARERDSSDGKTRFYKKTSSRVVEAQPGRMGRLRGISCRLLLSLTGKVIIVGGRDGTSGMAFTRGGRKPTASAPEDEHRGSAGVTNFRVRDRKCAGACETVKGI